MKGWKIRLGLVLTMLAMVLVVSVPASAQTTDEVWLEFGVGDCVDSDGDGVLDNGTILCPVDLDSLFGDFQQDFDEEDFLNELDLDEDFLSALLLDELDLDCDDDDGDLDCDDDDDCDHDGNRHNDDDDDCDD